MPGLALVARTAWGVAGESDTQGRRRDVAVAVHYGRITAVVPAAEVGSLGAERVVDLGDVTLMPAFVDAHVHLTATGLSLAGGDLAATRSARELLDRVGEAAARTPSGLVWGDGYDETRFRPLSASEAMAAARAAHPSGAGPEPHPGEPPRLPSPRQLAAAAAGRPVYLSRVDGHQGLATLDVLAASGALDAPGCERDAGGEPTGVVRDDANHRARRYALASMPAALLRAAQDTALRHAAARGVASVHEMGGPDISSRHDFELLLDRIDELPIEVLCYWGAPDLEYVVERKLGQIGGDLFLDGSLGSHTAALSVPYDDRPDTCGSLYLADDELTDLLTRATLAGVQVGVHAIGDVAIGQMLRCARRTVRAVGSAAFGELRHRVEHVELLGSDGADRMAALGLAASVQPAFDAAWGGPEGMYAKRLGQRRAKSMNPLADLWRRGVPMGGSSDANVTPPEPWHGVAAAVHHHRPYQRLGLPVALELFTLGGRILARQERLTGRIQPGQRADLTAFGGDVLAQDPAKLDGTEAVFTLAAGRLAHGPEELVVDDAPGPAGCA